MNVTDLSKSCPKCGCLDLSKKYHEALVGNPEHFRYFCRGCSYTWATPTLGTKTTKDRTRN